MAVDLFPQTKHCELLILFERVEYTNGSSTEAKPDAPQVTVEGNKSEHLDDTNPANTDVRQAASVAIDTACKEKEST